MVILKLEDIDDLTLPIVNHAIEQRRIGDPGNGQNLCTRHAAQRVFTPPIPFPRPHAAGAQGAKKDLSLLVVPAQNLQPLFLRSRYQKKLCARMAADRLAERARRQQPSAAVVAQQHQVEVSPELLMLESVIQNKNVDLLRAQYRHSRLVTLLPDAQGLAKEF